MISRTLKQVISAIILVALGLAGRGQFKAAHAQTSSQSGQTVNLIANFQLYGEVQRFGLGYGEMELHFGVNGPAASLGKMEFIPGGSFQGSGIFSDMNLPAYGTTVVDKTFSVPFTMEIDKPASLYMGIGDNGSGYFESGNIQVIFDFSDNMYFGGSILGSTCDQGFKLISVTMEDGTPLADNDLLLSFEPANTVLTVAVSAFDAQGAGLTTNSVLANDPAKRAFLMLNKATASAKLAGGPDVGGIATAAFVDLDLVQEPDPDVWDIGYATVSGTNNIILKRINTIPQATFEDVPTSHWAWNYVERLYSAGITGGCGTSPLIYCPETEVTRAQMAVFLEKGIWGSTFAAPNVTPTFNDTVGHWAEDWIEALRKDGITGGCGPNLYCPEDPVTRGQMAVFLLKAKYGSSYTPPAVGASTGFNDVPTTHWAAPWIKQLAAEGITGGCGTGIYCPENPVTRAEMAVFLVRTFNLP